MMRVTLLVCIRIQRVRRAKELDHPYLSVRDPIQQELKIAECVSAYNAGDMDEIARIHEHGEERRKWKTNHRNFRKYRARVSKALSSKSDNPS